MFNHYVYLRDSNDHIGYAEINESDGMIDFAFKCPHCERNDVEVNHLGGNLVECKHCDAETLIDLVIID